MDTQIALILVSVLFLVIPTTIGYAVGRTRSAWGRTEDVMAPIAGAASFMLWVIVGTWLYYLTEYGGWLLNLVGNGMAVLRIRIWRHLYVYSAVVFSDKKVSAPRLHLPDLHLIIRPCLITHILES